MSFSIIHLSDIHLVGNSDRINNRVIALKQACAGAIRNACDVVVAITGDVAYSGQTEQYQQADKILCEVSDYLRTEKNSNVSIVMVPGNHDCNFGNTNSVRDVLINSINPSIDADYFKTVNSTQENYAQFASKYGLQLNSVIETQEISVSGEKILFIKTNTAWMSVLHETPGRIIIPESMYPEIDHDDYKLIIALYHHPENWLNPDNKTKYIDFVRHNADIVLVGHEHLLDTYQQYNNTYSLLYNHGKELQDTDSAESAFSIFNFDETYQNYTLINFTWLDSGYKREDSIMMPFHRNAAVYESVFHPNDATLSVANDIGITINHFAKEDVILPDLYVCPYLRKTTYKASKKSSAIIKENVYDELKQNHINIITGSESSGKTAFMKSLYLMYAQDDICCIAINGCEIKTVDSSKLDDLIERYFVKQYSKAKLDEFRSLPKSKRVIIIDDIDYSALHGERRNTAIDYISDGFGCVYALLSSDVELPALLTLKSLNSMSSVVTYDILPLGNKKRRELISKWYHLHETTRDEEEIEKRIDSSAEQVDTFLGNGAGFIPAIPIFVICVLQNGDSFQQTYTGSQYGFLYETMIQKSLSSIAPEYKSSGAYNIDISIVSELAFYMLIHKKKTFSIDDISRIIDAFNISKKVEISKDDVIRKMIKAKIFYNDVSEGSLYKFKYPYIFYYFSGHYIAYHLNDEDVTTIIDEMSSKLYIEDYGNIMIFVCHFANNTRVIEAVLLNAYVTLDKFQLFDFKAADSVLSDISTAIKALIPNVIGADSDVECNKNDKLTRLDDAGINDGTVTDDSSVIDDELSDTEKDLAAISASFKTLDVLGQILQNYPGDIDGTLKVNIIDEIHKLGMRSVKAIIGTMGYLQNSLVEFIVERAKKENKAYRREDIESATKKLLDVLVSGMVRGMINKVAVSLNSPYLLPAAKEALLKENTISAKLILMDLKVNCLKTVDFQEITKLKEDLDNSKNTRFASCILSSIVSYYLSYNKCDYRLRAKLCAKFGFSEKEAQLKGQGRLLEQGY